MDDRLSRLRQIMQSAVDAQPVNTTEGWAAYIGRNPIEFQALDTSERSVKLRDINRVTAWTPGTALALQTMLDSMKASSLLDVSDADLSVIHDAMLQFEECARLGFDSPYSFSA